MSRDRLVAFHYPRGNKHAIMFVRATAKEAEADVEKFSKAAGRAISADVPINFVAHPADAQAAILRRTPAQRPLIVKNIAVDKINLVEASDDGPALYIEEARSPFMASAFTKRESADAFSWRKKIMTKFSEFMQSNPVEFDKSTMAEEPVHTIKPASANPDNMANSGGTIGTEINHPEIDRSEKTKDIQDGLQAAEVVGQIKDLKAAHLSETARPDEQQLATTIEGILGKIAVRAVDISEAQQQEIKFQREAEAAEVKNRKASLELERKNAKILEEQKQLMQEEEIEAEEGQNQTRPLGVNAFSSGAIQSASAYRNYADWMRKRGPGKFADRLNKFYRYIGLVRRDGYTEEELAANVKYASKELSLMQHVMTTRDLVVATLRGIQPDPTAIARVIWGGGIHLFKAAGEVAARQANNDLFTKAITKSLTGQTIDAMQHFYEIGPRGINREYIRPLRQKFQVDIVQTPPGSQLVHGVVMNPFSEPGVNPNANIPTYYPTYKTEPGLLKPVEPVVKVLTKVGGAVDRFQKMLNVGKTRKYPRNE